MEIKGKNTEFRNSTARLWSLGILQEPRQLLGGKKSPFSSIKWIPLWEKVDICPHVTRYRIIKTWSIDLNIQLNILRVLEEKRKYLQPWE